MFYKCLATFKGLRNIVFVKILLSENKPSKCFHFNLMLIKNINVLTATNLLQQQMGLATLLLFAQFI